MMLSIPLSPDKGVKNLEVRLHRLPHAPERLPFYATPGSAGMDVVAALDAPVVLNPLERRLIPTGLVMMLPEGYECQIRARSGLAIRHGVALANGVGTIDSDYREEVQVALINLSDKPFTVSPGDRIAQMVIAPVTRVEWREVDEVYPVEGRSGGFGSTGLR